MIIKTIEKCIDAGINPDTSHQDNNLLIYAVMCKKPKAVQTLLAKGASVDKRDSHLRTPLIYAVDNGSSEIAQILMEHKADVNAQDDGDQQSPLLYAIANHYSPISEVEKIVKNLIEHGAKTQQMIYGRTLVDVAKYWHHYCDRSKIISMLEQSNVK